MHNEFRVEFGKRPQRCRHGVFDTQTDQGFADERRLARRIGPGIDLKIDPGALHTERQGLRRR